MQQQLQVFQNIRVCWLKKPRFQVLENSQTKLVLGLGKSGLETRNHANSSMKTHAKTCRIRETHGVQFETHTMTIMMSSLNCKNKLSVENTYKLQSVIFFKQSGQGCPKQNNCLFQNYSKIYFRIQNFESYSRILDKIFLNFIFIENFIGKNHSSEELQ